MPWELTESFHSAMEILKVTSRQDLMPWTLLGYREYDLQDLTEKS